MGGAAVPMVCDHCDNEQVQALFEHIETHAESSQFQGRVVAALYADPHLMEKSGRTLVAAALALEYGLTDIDERQPHPLTQEDS
jgi:dehydrogenase/reductase SDR family member 1